MNDEGKPSEPAHDTLEHAFFSQGSDAAPTPSDAASTLIRPDQASVSAVGARDVDPTMRPDLAPDIDEDAILGKRKRGGLGAAGFALVAVGAALGAGAAYLLLKTPAAHRNDVPVVVASSTSTSTSTSTVAAASTAPSVATTKLESIASAMPSANEPTGRVGSRVPAAKSAGSIDMAGFSAPNAAGPGPAGGDPSGPSEAAAGELSSGEISGVVERNRPLIKRRCWQPELEIRKAMGSAVSARINAKFTISASGAVQLASASGSETDYPGLAGCIAGRIREWQFPASSGSTPVNVPFVFAAQ